MNVVGGDCGDSLTVSETKCGNNVKPSCMVWLVPNVFLCSVSAGGYTGDGEEAMSG